MRGYGISDEKLLLLKNLIENEYKIEIERM